MVSERQPFGFDTSMLDAISKYWWVLLIRGLVAIVFGIVAMVVPDITLFTLIILFGAYIVVDGVLEIWNGIMNRNVHDRWWVDILIGLAGVIGGLLVMTLPDVTATALMYFIAAWMVIVGILQIVYALRVRQEISNEWLIILAGLLSLLLGIYFFAFPGDGATSLVWLIGLYSILFGVLIVILAFRARKGFQ